MERLTIPDVKLDKNTISRSIIDAEKVKECAMEIYWRLKEIEDVVADDESEEYDLDRLRDLVEADRAGRCVVLPCKVGTTIYRIEYVQGSDGFEIGIKEHKFDYLLRLRDVGVEKIISVRDVIANDFLQRSLDDFRSISPFVKVLNRAVQYAYEEMM